MLKTFAACAVLLATASTPLLAQVDVCGSLSRGPGGFGPYDYRTATADQKLIVERRHFTPNVERLTKGETGYIGGDLAYTLESFPNHPSALRSMAGLARREKGRIPTEAKYSIDCWFERAIRFRPDDAQVRMVVGIELLKDNRTKEAIEQLEVAQKLAGSDANVHYNLGLAFFDLKQFDKSLDHAKKAYELGFPLPGLKNKLTKAGKWSD